jgi:TolB protein
MFGRGISRKARNTNLLGLLLLGFTLVARAQTEIEISKTTRPGEEKPIPVSLSGFTGEAAAVIQFDLGVQGFTFTSPDAAQYLLSGSNDANLTGRAQDRLNKNMLVNKSYTGASLRRQAHAFVDDFLAALGRKGLGQSKIAFKESSGKKGEIFISDFDGFNAQAVTHDGALVAAPEWVPGRLALYYVSYRNGGPQILFHDLGTGQRSVFAGYPGSNISPAVSPDGSKVAMILSKDGATDLYVGNADGSGLRRLTTSREDESSPCWSPDGQWICYAGKKDERRALWKISPSGGTPVRIPTTGVSSPSEPDWSPDGKWIVFTTARRGGFDICVVPATGGTATVLVGGEDPSWAPNSRTVVFANGLSGSRRLSLLDVPTKQVKDVSRISGSNSQPSWAK